MCIYVGVYVCMHACMYVCIYVCMYMYYVNMILEHVCMYVSVCMYICMDMYGYVCMYSESNLVCVLRGKYKSAIVECYLIWRHPNPAYIIHQLTYLLRSGHLCLTCSAANWALYNVA